VRTGEESFQFIALHAAHVGPKERRAVHALESRIILYLGYPRWHDRRTARGGVWLRTINRVWRHADVCHSVMEDVDMRGEQALAKGRDQIVSHSVDR
jgi:hypothetical protein